MASKEPDIYSFFISFKEYYGYEQEMLAKLRGTKENTKCYYFSSDPRNFGIEHVKDICVKFIMLYNVIDEKRQRKGNIVDDKDFTYLNYWLNSISKNAKIRPYITIREFQETMGDREGEFATFTLEKKLYDMKDEDYNNMVLLNELQNELGEIYNNMSKRMNEMNIPCMEYFKKYINTYGICITNCPDNDTGFCKVIEHFKGEYEKLFLGVDGLSKNCIDKERLKLPTYNDVSLAYKKNTIVGSVLGPSVATLFATAFLYKFTPFGQWIHSKMGTEKGVLDNLYEENEQLSLDNSENDNIRFGENPYLISYDSVVNS
ncbi:PIR Superfamily Protein [Plasmodium ovale curtisi]|uniref:PIR Superfamily Protein n=1 Tax=Plasmodium ovale curtisi TaxID=864141 RepID=A0A1A8WC25_PLAOA|nr:PIR Superfamily Protein [Plasmodium ovale curtisi]